MIKKLNSREAMNIDFRFKDKKHNAKIYEDLENEKTYVLLDSAVFFVTVLQPSEHILKKIKERIRNAKTTG